jgi:DNA-binding CsgD family transcriptional regulator
MNREKRISGELEQEMKGLYRKGLEVREIAVRYGFSPSAIFARFKKAGVILRGRKKLRGKEKEVLSAYKNGLSCASLGKRFNVSAMTIYNLVKGTGRLRSPGESQKARWHWNKHRGEIARRYINGGSALGLAKEFGCSKPGVLSCVREVYGQPYVRSRSPRKDVSQLAERTNEERAYFAGLFDGEGTVIIAKTGKHLHPRISIANTYRPVIEEISRLWGGRAGLNHRKNSARRKCWVWSASTREAESIIKCVLPYLKVKKLQAEFLLEFYETKSKERRKVIAKRISWLNRYGY